MDSPERLKLSPEEASAAGPPKLDVVRLIAPYSWVNYHNDADGYIAWRMGSGLNTELLHLKAFSPGNGAGKRLLKVMLTKLLTDPPFCTVFGFTRSINIEGRLFYADMGFELSPVTGVYRDGSAVLFSQEYKRLCTNHQIGA